jgi:PAS domain-containing protein
MAFFSQAENRNHNDAEIATAEPGPEEAEALLTELAGVFAGTGNPSQTSAEDSALAPETSAFSIEAKYRALLEQIPAVVFMAYVDRGTSEAYVSPEIEAALGYSREEWLEDPVRWYDPYPSRRQAAMERGSG